MCAAMNRARRGIFAAAVAASLGFGATQAFAAPAEPEQRGVCVQEVCSRLCRLISPFGGGCTPDGACVCFI